MSSMSTNNAGTSRDLVPIQNAKRPKRTRVQLACQRCKIRKQKCDGNQPECSTCARLEVDCRYIQPTAPKPQEAKLYIKALENRVAELEMALTNKGLGDAALDHWAQEARELPPPEEEEESHEVYSLLSAVRDVSLSTSGSFIGGTSNITLARMLESILGQQTPFITTPEAEGASPNFHREFDPSETGSRISIGSTFQDASFPNALRGIQSGMADKLLLAYFNHVAVNFPVVHSAHIRDIHRRREALSDPYEESVLDLVYALGGQFLEMTRELGNYEWRYHYEAALGRRDKILQLGDTRTLSYLLLLIQQCLRVPSDPGGWTFIGIAMRLCVELGLHRKKRQPVKPTLGTELEKRLFWACYYFDRDIAIALGRPPCISDHDIDIELPLDVDEECADSEMFQQAQPSDSPAFPPTSLTCFLHTVRLKRIESRIQSRIYRVDVSVSNLPQETERLLETLIAWKNAVLSQGNHKNEQNMNHYMLHYYKCTRLLLQPQLYETVINERYLDLCTKACAGVCETYRRLHDYFPVAFSTMSLQTVFLAGLTLVYCMWHSPSHTALKTMNALSDCSIMLYIMTERWPNIKRYRDAFEAIKRSVLELMSQGKHQIANEKPAVMGDVFTSLAGFDFDMIGEINRDDLENMFGNMTNMNSERMQFTGWHDTDMDFYDATSLSNNVISPQLRVLHRGGGSDSANWFGTGEMPGS